MNSNKEIKAGIGYTVANILIKGISFVSLPIFSRLMSTAEYGLYNTYVAYEAIIAIFIGLGMYSSIKNSVYDFNGRLQTFVDTQIVITTIAAVVILVGLMVFIHPIVNFTGFPAIVIILVVLQGYGTAMLNIENSRLALSYNYRNYMILAGINAIGNLGISILLLLTVCKEVKFVGRVLGSAVPLFLIGIYISIFEIKKKTVRFDAKMAKYSLAYGLPLIWHYLSQQIASQSDRIMITQMVGASYTGVYSFIYSLAGIFPILFYSLDNVWGVWFYKKMDEEDYCSINQVINKYIMVVFVLACGMIVCSRELIMVIGAKEYWSGIGNFIPILIGMFFLFLYTIPASVEYYYKETSYIAMMTMVSAIINIVLNYIFIGKYGYKAAAYTTAISYIIMFIAHWLKAKSLLIKKNVNPFMKVKPFLLYSSALLMVGLIVTLLNDFFILKYSVAMVVFVAIVLKYKRELRYYIKKKKKTIKK